MRQQFLVLGMIVGCVGLFGCNRGDQGAIQGVWVESGGDKAEMTFSGSEIRITYPGQSGGEKATFKLDSTKNPKQIDFESSEGRYTRAIYELDGNTLRWYSLEREPLTRPKQFPKSVSGQADVKVLKRK